MLKIINGRTIEDIGEIECKKCGCVTDADYRYIESNNSIQARCLECQAFIKNVKQIKLIEGVNAEEPYINQLFFSNMFYKKKLPITKKQANDLICILKKVDEDYDV